VSDGAKEGGRDLLEVKGESCEVRVIEGRIGGFVRFGYDLSLETFEKREVEQELETIVVGERGVAKVDNDEGTRKTVEESFWESDVSILKDVESFEALESLNGFDDLFDRFIVLYDGFGESSCVLIDREVETESLSS